MASVPDFSCLDTFNFTDKPTPRTAVPSLTVLLPCYNEQAQLSTTFSKLTAILGDQVEQGRISAYEILLVDDGSSDLSWQLISKASEIDSHIRGLRLSRNFGKEIAWVAGLRNLKTNVVVLMDCDLQHPPECIAEMIDGWYEGYDIVEGVKSDRGKESFFSKLNANTFYGLFKHYTGFQLKDASDFKLLDQSVYEKWSLLDEKAPFFRGQSAWLGFKRKTFTFEVQEREFGTSRWSVWNLLRLSLDAITGFSAKPLFASAFIGLFFLLLFFVIAIQTLIKFFSGTAVTGFTTVIMLELLIGGLITLSLGLVGIYIARIFDEVKKRPLFVISESVGEPLCDTTAKNNETQQHTTQQG